DDLVYVRNNEAVHSFGGALATFVSEYPADGLYRPLTALSYAIDHAVWGLAPVGYHLTNLLLWALTAIVVDAFASRRLSAGPALAATLLYVAHPAHCEV